MPNIKTPAEAIAYKAKLESLGLVTNEALLAEVSKRVISNPVFTRIISDLIDSQLYTSNLSSLHPSKEEILQYKSQDNVEASALDVIADSISREIIKGFKEGFSDIQDGASNVNYSSINATAAPLTSMGTVDNVNDAISCLTAEVQLLKSILVTFFGAVSTTLPPAVTAASALSTPASFTPTAGKIPNL